MVGDGIIFWLSLEGAEKAAVIESLHGGNNGLTAPSMAQTGDFIFFSTHGDECRPRAASVGVVRSKEVSEERAAPLCPLCVEAGRASEMETVSPCCYTRDVEFEGDSLHQGFLLPGERDEAARTRNSHHSSRPTPRPTVSPLGKRGGA